MDTQAVPVLHGGVAGEAQLRLLARALADQFGLRVGGGLVRVVAPLLTLEVRPGVAAAPPGRLALRPEALQRGPRLDERAIDAEVIIGDPPVMPGQFHHRGKEQIRHRVLQEPLLVLAVGRGVKHRLVQRQVHEPAEQQVGLQPRAELTVRAHRVERLQPLALQQRLRRDRRRAGRRVDRVEVLAHRGEHLIAQFFDHPDRMIGGDQRLHVDQTYKAGLGTSPRMPLRRAGSHIVQSSLDFFSSLLYCHAS